MAGESRLRRTCALALAIGSAWLVLLSIAPLTWAETLPPPGGFRLQASNGYALEVVSFHKPDTERGEVLVLLHAPHAAVLYFVRATVNDTSIEADLGFVGKIDVDFMPSGKPRVEHPACGKPVAVDSGRYVGTIEFNGEQGYAEAHKIAAPGEAKFALSLVCGGSEDEGVGGSSPGALLTARDRRGARFEFTARKNSPSRVARFAASISERRGSLQVDRAIEVEAKPAAFEYDVAAGVATVTPPAPFDGEAMYSRTPKRGVAWRGDLSVDFPGRAGVPLTGRGTRASLVRAVQNPSHPFRVP
jgi:hypothetical protein